MTVQRDKVIMRVEESGSGMKHWYIQLDIDARPSIPFVVYYNQSLVNPS